MHDPQTPPRSIHSLLLSSRKLLVALAVSCQQSLQPPACTTYLLRRIIHIIPHGILSPTRTRIPLHITQISLYSLFSASAGVSVTPSPVPSQPPWNLWERLSQWPTSGTSVMRNLTGNAGYVVRSQHDTIVCEELDVKPHPGRTAQ
jgi:hypothetical protein